MDVGANLCLLPNPNALRYLTAELTFSANDSLSPHDTFLYWL